MELEQARPVIARLRKRWPMVALVLVCSVGCDRVTKEYAQDSLMGAGRISMLRVTVRVEYAENKGAFLSLGANLPGPLRGILLTLGAALMAIAVLGMALFGDGRTKLEVAALALIASGGLGNLWDRVMRDGAVVDFMNLGIGPVRTGIFNVADLAIVAGVAMFVFGKKRPEETPAPPPAPAA
jgi:signal peptidase II